MATVIVSGAIANKYLNGGEAWVRLSWVLGLRRLGLDTYFVEQIAPERCVDDTGVVTSFEECVNRSYFEAVVDEFGLGGSAALVYGDGPATAGGLSYKQVLEIAESADLLVNISGHLGLDAVRRRVGRRVYVDLDPGFTQFWHAEGNPGARLDGHDLHFTVGANVGRPGCGIPTGGIAWKHVPPPVVLAEWPVSNGGFTAFRTIATWRGPYGPVERGGRTFGLKVHEFRKLIDLPRRAEEPFEIALDIHPADVADLERLRAGGWRITDPRAVAGDPLAFRCYVQASGAEFSAAQGIYVETGSGWFSDRTARYLASGKPALVQDTGFSRDYSAGEGLVPFRTLEEAVTEAERIVRDYDAHCEAARAIAEKHFDSDRVLARFLEQVGTQP